MHTKRKQPMIVKHQNHKYLRVTLISVFLVITTGLSACGTPAPTLEPTPANGVTVAPTALTNSESASQIAELEAKIRELEAEKQRLLAENQQLSSDLGEMTSTLQDIESQVPHILITVTEIQNDTSDFAAYLQGLPSLPTPPLGLTVGQIDDAINKAVFLRGILENLPPPPPLIAPPEWYELDEMKDEFIRMTEWMEDLEELPEFLNIAGDLDDLRYQEIAHMQNINTAMDDVKRILEEVRDAVGP